MVRKKTPTAATLLVRIKEAEDYQEVDNWRSSCKRLLGYLVGDYGTIMYETKYRINTIYNLVNLIIPNLYFQNPHLIVKPEKRFFIKKKGDSHLKIDGYKRAQLMESALNKEIKVMRFKHEVRECLQDVLLTGIGVMKFGHVGSTAYDTDIESLSDGDIFAQRVNPFDYLPDPMATKPRNTRFEVYRFVDTTDNIKENDLYSNTDELEGTSLSEFTPRKKKKEKSKDSEKWLELYEYHDHEKDKTYVLTKDMNKSKMLYNEDRKYDMQGSDFLVMKFTGDNDTFRGIAPLLMVEDEALALNEVLSLTINHLQKFAGVVLYEEGALDDDDITRFENGEQGELLQTQNGALREGRVRRESPLSAGMDYYNNFNVLQNSIDRTLAIPDFQRSAMSGKRKTAFEVSVSAGDAQNRRGYYLGFVKDFVIESAKKITALMQQFYDKKRQMEMEGDFNEWIEWTKEDIQGEYSFDFDIEDIKVYSASKAQAIINALQVMGPLQIFQQVWQKIDPMKLANQIFKNMDLDIRAIEKKTDFAHYEHDPYVENELILSGKRVIDPHFGEPHEEHINIHTNALLAAQEKKNEKAITEGTRHIQMHQYWMTVIPSMGKPVAAPATPPKVPETAPIPGGGMGGMEGMGGI